MERLNNARGIIQSGSAALCCSVWYSQVLSIYAESLPLKDTRTSEPAADLHSGVMNSREQARPVRELPQADTRALMNWAIYLSTYKDSQRTYYPPDVLFEPQAFFVAKACGGQPSCKVLGWYADRGVIHVHSRS